MVLIVDVGTNAELLLGNETRVLACSSPTGPAFEGAQISSGQRAAPGAIERVEIDAVTKEARLHVPSYWNLLRLRALEQPGSAPPLVRIAHGFRLRDRDCSQPSDGNLGSNAPKAPPRCDDRQFPSPQVRDRNVYPRYLQ
jgi:hypothetical protein